MSRMIIGGAVFALLAATPATARMEKCLLEVDGQPYILGRCNVDREPDGSLSVGTGDRKTASPFFAYIEKHEDGSARGTWNETAGSTSAHAELGSLKQDGACWRNARASICAWDPTHQPFKGP